MSKSQTYGPSTRGVCCYCRTSSPGRENRVGFSAVGRLFPWGVLPERKHRKNVLKDLPPGLVLRVLGFSQSERETFRLRAVVVEGAAAGGAERARGVFSKVA
jgi:hypothetical protein